MRIVCWQILIQTLWYSDSIPKKLLKKGFEKISAYNKKACKITQYAEWNLPSSSSPIVNTEAILRYRFPTLSVLLTCLSSYICSFLM